MLTMAAFGSIRRRIEFNSAMRDIRVQRAPVPLLNPDRSINLKGLMTRAVARARKVRAALSRTTVQSWGDAMRAALKAVWAEARREAEALTSFDRLADQGARRLAVAPARGR
jgi:hypothetical protein